MYFKIWFLMATFFHLFYFKWRLWMIQSLHTAHNEQSQFVVDCVIIDFFCFPQKFNRIHILVHFRTHFVSDTSEFRVVIGDSLQPYSKSGIRKKKWFSFVLNFRELIKAHGGGINNNRKVLVPTNKHNWICYMNMTCVFPSSRIDCVTGIFLINDHCCMFFFHFIFFFYSLELFVHQSKYSSHFFIVCLV